MESDSEKKKIGSAIALARRAKPAYADLYALLEPLLQLQIDARNSFDSACPLPDSTAVKTAWEAGRPIFQPKDLPVDTGAAQLVLEGMSDHIPESNKQLGEAHRALRKAVGKRSAHRENLWRSLMFDEVESWDEWIETEGVDEASILFWARSCLRPGIERAAREITSIYSVPKDWLKGYCPVCGALPALLYLSRDGERNAHCSLCATHWELHRLQCPCCGNRQHESLGYIYIETEPQYRIHYCKLCNCYFKQIDTKEMSEAPLLALEEWTTLHLDLLAQRAGWSQPGASAPAV